MGDQVSPKQIIWIGFDLALLTEVKKQLPEYKALHVVLLRRRSAQQSASETPEAKQRELVKGKKLIDAAKAANMDGIDFESNPDSVTTELLQYAHMQQLETAVWVFGAVEGSDSPESLNYYTAASVDYFTSNMPPFLARL